MDANADVQCTRSVQDATLAGLYAQSVAGRQAAQAQILPNPVLPVGMPMLNQAPGQGNQVLPQLGQPVQQNNNQVANQLGPAGGNPGAGNRDNEEMKGGGFDEHQERRQIAS